MPKANNQLNKSTASKRGPSGCPNQHAITPPNNSLPSKARKAATKPICLKNKNLHTGDAVKTNKLILGIVRLIYKVGTDQWGEPIDMPSFARYYSRCPTSREKISSIRANRL